MQHALQLLQAAWHGFQVAAPWLVTLFIPSLIVGLTPFPQAAGAITVLKTILNFLSVVAHHDSPGTFKLPLTMSRAPTGATPTGTPPSATDDPTAGDSASPVVTGPAAGAAVVLALLCATAAVAGCAASAAEWKATGIDEAKCAAPAIAGAILGGLIDLLDDAAGGQSPNYQQIGTSLAEQYGPTAAACAIQVAWQHLGASTGTDGGAPPAAAPATIAAGDPPATTAKAALATTAKEPSSVTRLARRAAALDWLVHHQSEWAAPARR
jgi:hypothetical protein